MVSATPNIQQSAKQAGVSEIEFWAVPRQNLVHSKNE
jgi:hypothetical protein